MGWLKSLVGFENSFSKNFAKDIINDPKRLITGIDPVSTKMWNGVTGSDNESLVNVWGSPGQQYYAKASEEGIDVAPAAVFHSVADKVAAYFAAQGLGVDASLLNKGASFFDEKPNVTTPGNNTPGSNVFQLFSNTDYVNQLFSAGKDTAVSLMPSSFNSKDFAPIGSGSGSGSGTVTMSKSSANIGTPSNAVTGAPIVPSNYENMYGGIADSYAAKFNIPLDVFRDAIRRTSDFDPNHNGGFGKGIAGIDVGSTKIDQNDVGSQLNFAAQYMADRYKKIGDWDRTIQDYLIGDPLNEIDDGKTLADNEAALNGKNTTGTPEESKSLWKYEMSDIQNLFKNSAWTILFTLVGVVIIIASLYVLIMKSGDNGK